MAQRTNIGLAALSVCIALVSLALVGIQLIWSSSEAAYAAQFAVLAALIGALLHKSRSTGRPFPQRWLVAAAVAAALLPIEGVASFLSDLSRLDRLPEAGEAYVNRRTLLDYPGAVGVLLIVHGALLTGAALLMRQASAGPDRGTG